MLLEFPFRYDFEQPIRLMPGNVPRRRKNQHANCRFVIATTDYDFVVGFYGVRRLCRMAVKQNKTRFAKLLSNRTTRAEAAKFKKKIETHCSGQSKGAKRTSNGAKRKEQRAKSRSVSALYPLPFGFCPWPLLLRAATYGFGNIPRILPLPFGFLESLRTAAAGGTIFRSGSTVSL
jgi:hypothetical protein